MSVVAWRHLEFGLKVLMAVNLFVMMLLTSADVISRYVLNAPISGAFEIVQYLMGVLIFAGLPVTTASDSHLSVSLLPRTMSGLKGWIHRSFIGLVSAGGLLLIASCMTEQASVLYASKQVSGYLEIPLGPVAAVMAVFAWFAFIISSTQFVRTLLGHVETTSDPDSLARTYE